jgi:hypothetical protein
MGGMSKTKTVTKNEPWAPSQPYILKNLQQQDDVFTSTQPQLDKFAGMQRDTYGRVAPGAEQGIIGAQGLVNHNLNGDNLNGNPYLDAIIGQRNQDVAGGVNDQFSEAGRYGSGQHAAILGRELAKADDSLRFQNYGVERGYQQDAIGQAGNLMQGSQSLLNNAAELPWIGVQAANGAVRQASSGYGTQTQTSKGSVFDSLLKAGATAAQAAAMASDRRLKVDVEKVGEEADGLGLYRYRYVTDAPDAPLRDGVMADEVATLRPWALGPTRGGFQTVDYGAL